MNIENSIALVTGANRGLGKAYTDALLAAGAAKVYADARDRSSVAITDPRLVPVKLDVTRDIDVQAAATACPDVNLLINMPGSCSGARCWRNAPRPHSGPRWK